MYATRMWLGDGDDPLAIDPGVTDTASCPDGSQPINGECPLVELGVQGYGSDPDPISISPGVTTTPTLTIPPVTFNIPGLPAPIVLPTPAATGSSGSLETIAIVGVLAVLGYVGLSKRRGRRSSYE